MKIHSPSRHQAIVLFTLFVLFETLLCAFFILQDRVPQGHDAFQYFTLQYYFLNGLIQYNELPQWMPYMTQGTIATWWYAVQGGIGALALYPLAPWLKGLHFHTVFHLAMWIETLLFLSGVWLLARRHFQSLAVVAFVVAGCMGPFEWYDQPWFNFHLVYLIPLILHLWHLFWDSGKYRYLFVAANFFVLQIIGGLPYFVPLTTLIIALYVGCHLFTEFRRSRADFFVRIKTPVRFIGLVVMTGLGLWIVSQLLTFGTGQIVNYNEGRAQDGSVTLRNFITYGADPIVWSLEPFLRLPLRLDYTIYTGFFSLLALFWIRRSQGARRILFLFPLVFLLLFSLGTIVSVVTYLVWPKMNYYRHLTHVYSILRFFLVFAAGLGVERIAQWKIGEDKKSILAASWVMLLFVGLVGSFLVSPSIITQYVEDPYMIAGAFQAMLDPSAVRSALSIALFFGLATLAWLYAVLSGRLGPTRGILLLVLIQCIDMGAYRAWLAVSRTHPLSALEKETVRFQPVPYRARRETNYHNNPRFRALNYFYTARPGLRVPYGGLNWTSETFFYQDAPGTSWRVDHWLLPLDDLLRFYWQMPLRNFSVLPSFGPGVTLVAPVNHPGFRKMAGMDVDKVQLFSGVNVATNSTDVVSAWSKKFDADALWVEMPEQAAAVPSGPSRRLALSYTVSRFEPNRVELDVVIPEGVSHPWVYYADVFHPEWRATVDDQKVETYKANLAYKAVPLTPGKHRLAFSFYSEKIALFQMILSFNALALLLLVSLNALCEFVRSVSKAKTANVLPENVPPFPA